MINYNSPHFQCTVKNTVWKQICYSFKWFRHESFRQEIHHHYSTLLEEIALPIGVNLQYVSWPMRAILRCLPTLHQSPTLHIKLYWHRSQLYWRTVSSPTRVCHCRTYSSICDQRMWENNCWMRLKRVVPLEKRLDWTTGFRSKPLGSGWVWLWCWNAIGRVFLQCSRLSLARHEYPAESLPPSLQPLLAY